MFSLTHLLYVNEMQFKGLKKNCFVAQDTDYMKKGK
jgi:hypothetical protein